MNRVISFGIDCGWRRAAVDALALGAEAASNRAPAVLDLATGTGDVAIAVAGRWPTARVVGTDVSRGMLEVARGKIRRAGLDARVDLGLGSAEAIPFGDASFDAVTIAFGIRNVADRARALREMARVTRPGGRVVVLELSDPTDGVLSRLARFHIHTVVPALGALLTGAPEYRYLERSIAAFPAPAAFASLAAANGLDVVSWTTLTFGAALLLVARPEAAP